MTEHTVYHPRLEGVVRTVADKKSRDAHKGAGWRMTPKGDEDREAAVQAAESDILTD